MGRFDSCPPSRGCGMVDRDALKASFGACEFESPAAPVLEDSTGVQAGLINLLSRLITVSGVGSIPQSSTKFSFL